VAFVEDPRLEVMRRIRELSRKTSFPAADMDEQELDEREEAAQAYGREDEQHFVDYCEDCIRASVVANTEIRRKQTECFSVFMEEEPPNYANKEDWQSRVVIPKPFGAVQFAMSIVRKAFDVEFLSIENEKDNLAAAFWKKLMGFQLDRNRANFPIRFTDACGMGFVTGISMEMVPVWRQGRGLQYLLVEPWKIHRDPDALSREPQSGMYWIHQEWLDSWTLKQFEKEGRYVNIGNFSKESIEGGSKDDPNISREAIAHRKGQVWHRSQYRTMVLTSEFWGTVLDRRGELLLPNATYTIAGGRVIQLPKRGPYRTLRWPGISFSPLPHFLRYDGRGLIEGIKSLWYFMCALMSLHNDNLNWIVNPPTEINVSALVDPEDIDSYPGKTYLTRDTASGQQVVRTVDRKSTTSDTLANLNYADQRTQEGTFITNLVQGLPGYRAEVTARESAQSLEQALTVFSLIGKNLEDGALNAILAGAETVAANIGIDDLRELFEDLDIQQFISRESPTGIQLPLLTTGSFHISGISALQRDWEIIRNIRDIVIPLCQEGTVFLPYIKPYNLLRSIEKRLNLSDEGIFVDKATAQAIDQHQQEAQEQAIELKRQQEMAATEQAMRQAAATGSEGMPAIVPAEGVQ